MASMLSFYGQRAGLCIGLTTTLALAGCLGDSNGGNGDRDDLGGGSTDSAAFADLAGHWEGTGLNLFGGEVEAWDAQVRIRGDGTIDYIQEDFILLENLGPDGTRDRVYAYENENGRRQFIQLVNKAGTHALGITEDGRPMVLEKGGITTSFQAHALVGEWAGDMFAVEDFPPRLVERQSNIGFVVDSLGVATISVPGLCEGLTIEALELRQDPGFGQNYWIADDLIDTGEGSDCPSPADPSFTRVIMTPDESHIGLSICDRADEAANGCGLFLLERNNP